MRSEIKGMFICDHFLPVRRQPHPFFRPGPNPPRWAIGRRLVVRQRRSGRAREFYVAIGGDQAARVRMPSSFCATYVMKPYRGLVLTPGTFRSRSSSTHRPYDVDVADNALSRSLAVDDVYYPASRRRRCSGLHKALGRRRQKALKSVWSRKVFSSHTKPR